MGSGWIATDGRQQRRLTEKMDETPTWICDGCQHSALGERDAKLAVSDYLISPPACKEAWPRSGAGRSSSSAQLQVSARIRTLESLHGGCAREWADAKMMRKASDRGEEGVPESVVASP